MLPSISIDDVILRHCSLVAFAESSDYFNGPESLTMATASAAVLLHLQKFWISLVESSAMIPLEQRFRQPDGVKLALERRFGQPDGVKLDLERRFGQSGSVELALERRFGRPDDAKLALERRSSRPGGAKGAVERRQVGPGTAFEAPPKF